MWRRLVGFVRPVVRDWWFLAWHWPRIHAAHGRPFRWGVADDEVRCDRCGYPR